MKTSTPDCVKLYLYARYQDNEPDEDIELVGELSVRKNELPKELVARNGGQRVYRFVE
uniref:Uncharacterized protein n=1 Tax=viral metagenome TaxID=1070528 RepID=A0A6M3KAF3_9ZZZZ